MFKGVNRNIYTLKFFLRIIYIYTFGQNLIMYLSLLET